MTGPGFLAMAVEKAARRVWLGSAGDARPKYSELCVLDLYCLRWLESRGRLGRDERVSARPPAYTNDSWLGTGAGPRQGRA